ncbi:MAG TPA: GNAT family N-acetyltransferase [Mycobacteriales bacterium]|nr:GNAT family N-acetyltransferase [Mycobacteriales bacterium]
MIRRVRPDDVDLFRQVRLRALADAPSAFGSTYAAERALPRAHWVDRTTRAAASGDLAVFLAFDDTDCVGLAGGKEDDLGADRQLISMWVDASHRGTAVAAGLVDAVVEWARGGGARSIGLWVTRGNDRAQSFYERMGFKVTGDVQPLPSDPCKDEIRMLRLL